MDQIVPTVRGMRAKNGAPVRQGTEAGAGRRDGVDKVGKQRLNRDQILQLNADGKEPAEVARA